MRRFLAALTVCVAFLATIPTNADASPHWRPFIKDEYAYAIGSNYGPKAAAIVKVPNRKNVTIPRAVTYKGKRYRVAAIWDGAIGRNVRSIDIQTPYLDCIEDDTIFDSKKVRVIVHDRDTYAWLRTWLKNRVTLK